MYTRYKPVDPGLAARILRQMGQPYDPALIPKGEEFYIGGWDNGDANGEGGADIVNYSDGGGAAASGTLDRYRESEVVPVPAAGGYLDAGASRDNEARNKFAADPLASMEVRGKAKSNTYGPNRIYNDNPNHQGVDLWARNGTDVQSVGDGVIHETGEAKEYGKYIIVRFDHNGEPRYALYAHLSDNSMPKDTPVKAGQVIGISGSTGNAGGDKNPLEDQHLHFELADSPEFGHGMGWGRRDPMPHFRTRMEVDENK